MSITTPHSSLCSAWKMLQPRCIDVCGNPVLPRPFLGFRTGNHRFPAAISGVRGSPRFSCRFSEPRKGWRGSLVKGKKKENVWSIDNELSAGEAAVEGKKSSRRRRRGRPSRRVVRDSRVLISGSMLVEIENVLQTQEPVIKPAWSTFASSVSGIWKGVGAVFSPFTAEMEPIGIGSQNENLYDCYTLSRVERVAADDGFCPIRSVTNWVPLNPFGEMHRHIGKSSAAKDSSGTSATVEESYDVVHDGHDLPTFETFDFGKSELLQEDLMGMEPGLVFFEELLFLMQDGSYSRGPVELLVGEYDESKYFLSPTFKFEQCLVKGCHKRLRIVHTIEFSEGGSNIQITRVAVFEEQWISPANLYDENDASFDLKPISQRKRTQPSELIGSWKVFEVSATPIFSEGVPVEEGGLPYVYLCTETLKKRSLPESALYFGEEEIHDLQNVTILWLPGGVTGYVDVTKDGTLCIGVGWYSDEGINLVMERDYGIDGKLKERNSVAYVIWYNGKFR
ncbi:Lipocalins domain-containing protein [Dioscorea alata]|uniref:Lipocalins domain-containing protein n=1 Tax=Dioscorea alata TaxID=55571 RepID=A0ACB7WHL4_DIOAL|nr:Lipocalins domain-containing protein [Dioscorea alata]